MSSPSKSESKSQTLFTVFRLIVIVVGVGLLGTWLVALGNARGKIDVTLVNRTGKPLQDVAIGVGPGDVSSPRFARVDDGETVRLRVPSAEQVVVRLKDGDGRDRRAEYPFAAGPGLWHTMQITVTPSSSEPGKFARVGRKSESSSSAVLGATVSYEEPVDQFEDLAAPRRSDQQGDRPR